VRSALRATVLDPITPQSLDDPSHRFRARLETDSVEPRGQRHSDGFHLPKGTVLYLKATKTSIAVGSGHTVDFVVDYVVMDGQHVPLPTFPEHRWVSDTGAVPNPTWNWSRIEFLLQDQLEITEAQANAIEKADPSAPTAANSDSAPPASTNPAP